MYQNSQNIAQSNKVSLNNNNNISVTGQNYFQVKIFNLGWVWIFFVSSP